MLDTGRQNDLNDLRTAYKQASSDGERREIENTARSISQQSQRLSDARQALIRESRNGNVQNMKDINLDIQKNY